MENSRRNPSLTFVLLVLVISWCSCAEASPYAQAQDNFLGCLSPNFNKSSNVIFTPSNSSYESILEFSIQNLRFTTKSTPKPQVIITPKDESEIPPIILCAKQNGMQIRTRSGGHDYEGLSYVSEVPFVVLDLINFSEITIDAKEKTGWVGSGATLGQLYYKIAQLSPTLGFPAGVCPTIGVGGHFSGGGYGMLLRKYGLAADNVLDARLVDAQGRILDRKSMGEDLFWAIRGGGGASFGVILSWKIQLVDVPEKVTVFTIHKSVEQNAIQLVQHWQSIAPRFDSNLFIRIIIKRDNSTRGPKAAPNVTASFNSIYFGGVDQLLPLMKKSFPELGLTREDCQEMKWIESIPYFAEIPLKPLELLLNRTQATVKNFKAKSDYVQTPIPESGLQGIWRLFSEPEAAESQMIFSPYGAKMDEIPESSIPFPHRKGNLFKIQHLVYWEKEQVGNSDQFISWIRKLYSYMAPYVSKSPRAAYVNYRDLDIGANNNTGIISYEQASVCGKKYFKSNFDRLVQVKTKVDPDNFFRNEQSIPPVHSSSSS